MNLPAFGLEQDGPFAGKAAAIVRDGAEKFRSLGTENCPGTKLVALSGKLQRTGVVEVPMGTPLSKIVAEIAGRVRAIAGVRGIHILSDGCEAVVAKIVQEARLA